MAAATASELAAAIERGLAYLRTNQRPGGEWPTLRSPALDLAGAEAYPCSVYVTTFVVHHLVALGRRFLVADMVERAAGFLIGERDEHGLWNYEGRGGTRLHPDLDDTACAVAALQRVGQAPELSFYRHLWANESAPGGPYYTWVGVADRTLPGAQDVDPLVNANLVLCCGLLGVELPGSIADLNRRVLAGDYSSQYCISPHFLVYAIARAFADGGAQGLAPAMPALQTHALERLPGPHAEPASFNTACLALALFFTGAAGRAAPHVQALLAQQQPSGAWAGWAAYASFDRWYDGAPALTTALALAALDGALH